MHYRIGYSYNKENSSIYSEHSIRQPGVNHPVRKIDRRSGKKNDLLKKNPNAIAELQKEVDRMNDAAKKSRTFTPTVSIKECITELGEKGRESLAYRDARSLCRTSASLADI